MKILDYDDINPLQVLYLTMLALDFPFTPEHATHIRQTDPRPFPCFTVNAVEDEMVLGQVGVFRLPMISAEGREEVGGVWAVSTHPNYARRGIASALLDEATPECARLVCAFPHSAQIDREYPMDYINGTDMLT